MQLTTIWIEIPASDIERAARFYGAVFDTSLDISSDEVRRTATITNTEATGVGASLTETAGFEPGEQGPLVYFLAEGAIEAMLERVKAAGGQVLIPRTSMGQDAGYFATFKDSEGNVLAFYSST